MSRILDVAKRMIAAGKAASGAIENWRWTARSTVFAAFFAGTSFWLALKGLLTPEYVASIGAVHGLLIVRAVFEDRKKKGDDDDDNPDDDRSDANPNDAGG